jgi:hypothetical protein
MLPGAQEGFLSQVFGVVLVSSHTVSQFIDSPGMVLHEEPEGFVIPLLRLTKPGV